MNQIIENIFKKMFIEGYSRLPSFINLNIIEIDLDKSVEEFISYEASLVDLEKIEINCFFKLLKSKDSIKTDTFINFAIDLYFTHPLVTACIQDGRRTLFPNERLLKDINYDLLIPVFEKGLKDEE